MRAATESRFIFRFVIIVLLALTAALIFIPNRWWRAASERLAPPEDFRAAPKADPWG